MPNITIIIVSCVVCGFVFLALAEYLSGLARQQPPAPQLKPVPDKKQALQDIKQWPLKEAKYLKDEPFFSSVLQVLDKQPWIEIGMVIHPNSIASRDAFIQAICRQHRERFAQAVSDEQAKYHDKARKLLDEIRKQMQGVNFTCHRCTATRAIARTAIIEFLLTLFFTSVLISCIFINNLN
jgi:hypothetical protein